MFFNYKTYEEIPPTIVQYIHTVADITNIVEVSLTEINDFLNMQEEEGGVVP
tara:strand:- start:407 stop:562 length:156 start_codon:yes stop_codon:yes gene_type:complete